MTPITLYENFKKYFPEYANSIISYRQLSGHELFILLKDNKIVTYSQQKNKPDKYIVEIRNF